MITAVEKLNETIEYYNEQVDPIKAFMFNKTEEKLFSDMMIEFAKMHVTEALKQASEKVRAPYDSDGDKIIDKESILTAYNLDKIK